MLTHFTRRRVLWLTASFIAIIVALKLYAGVRLTNTINPSAEILNNGEEVVLTGPIQCSEPGTTVIRVTLTQRTTGAIAEGQTVFECSTTLQQWRAVVHTRGKERFVPGQAVAVALGFGRGSTGVIEDAHQWLVNVNLYNGI